MSMNRVCPICYKMEAFRFNFGNDWEGETRYHRETKCECGYSSREEMMEDQDLGFTDPYWVGIVKYFLDRYYLSLSQGRIPNKDEHARFFLKLLKRSASNYGLSIVLEKNPPREPYKPGDPKIYGPIYTQDGVPEKKPKQNIFDNDYALDNVPEQVVLEALNKNLLRSYKHEVERLEKFDKFKNRTILVLFVLLIIFIVISFF